MLLLGWVGLAEPHILSQFVFQTVSAASLRSGTCEAAGAGTQSIYFLAQKWSAYTLKAEGRHADNIAVTDGNLRCRR